MVRCASAGASAALLGAAQWMRERRLELAALEVRECAKPWGEADGDVCEAIDFLEYYARGAVALDAGAELIQVPGERNEMRYAAAWRRRGDLAMEFPDRDPVRDDLGRAGDRQLGGAQAGRAVSRAARFGCSRRFEREASRPQRSRCSPARAKSAPSWWPIPPCRRSPSPARCQVGLEIIRAAAEVRPGQLAIKRVIAELGGKNCVIVDSDADLDDAVPAIVSSAFVYAGQKCSAAARVLVHEAIADTLIERISGAVESLIVGQAEQLGTDVPPVIERSAQERVARYAELAAQQGRIAARVDSVPDRGWFCPPTVAVDLAPDSPVLSEEIFGPVLARGRPVGGLAAIVRDAKGLRSELLRRRQDCAVRHYLRVECRGVLHELRAEGDLQANRRPGRDRAAHFRGRRLQRPRLLGLRRRDRQPAYGL